MFTDKITIVTTRAVFIAGDPFAEGAKVKLPPATAWECVAGGFAAFANPDDEVRARESYEQEQRAMLLHLGATRSVGGSPWIPR